MKAKTITNSELVRITLIALQAARSATRLEARNLMLKNNISLEEIGLFQLIEESATTSMTESSAFFGHSTAAATGRIDRLERSGCVKRNRAQLDRRKVFIELDYVGTKLLEVFSGAFKASMKSQTGSDEFTLAA